MYVCPAARVADVDACRFLCVFCVLILINQFVRRYAFITHLPPFYEGKRAHQLALDGIVHFLRLGNCSNPSPGLYENTPQAFAR